MVYSPWLYETMLTRRGRTRLAVCLLHTDVRLLWATGEEPSPQAGTQALPSAFTFERQVILSRRKAGLLTCNKVTEEMNHAKNLCLSQTV